MKFYLGLFGLITLSDREWFCATTSDGVSAESALLSSGVQLMSYEKAYYYFYNLKRNELATSLGIFRRAADIHMCTTRAYRDISWNGDQSTRKGATDSRDPDASNHPKPFCYL